MADAKPLASLTSGLLARKGGAKPAMRRQVSLSGHVDHAMHNFVPSGQDDLGWNDMGYDVNPDQSQVAPDDGHRSADNRAMLSPMETATLNDAQPLVSDRHHVPDAALPNILHQQAALASAIKNAPAAAPRKMRRQAGAKGTFAFTLRLDPDRHMKLRLASALKNISAQNMLTDAVDQLLGAIPGLDAVAAQARNAMPGGSKS